MYVNIINSYRTVITVCDKELLGKTFEEGNKQLDIKESFYKGEEGKIMATEEIKKIIQVWAQEDATFNIVGEKSIQLFLQKNIIDKNSVRNINKIPYAMILL